MKVFYHGHIILGPCVSNIIIILIKGSFWSKRALLIKSDFWRKVNKNINKDILYFLNGRKRHEIIKGSWDDSLIHS